MNVDFLRGPIGENQYVNIEYFKRGGMGEIYTAKNTADGSKVAIKIISPQDKDEIDLLSEESRVALSLVHPNIIRTHYSGQFTLNGNLYLYTVMEFLSNGSLRDLLMNSTQVIEIRKAIKYMLDIAQGLSAAHKCIIHRDLKPENILVGESGLKVCDFGLARYIDATTRSKTYKGAGTLPYMAPECWIMEQNTVAMDIYSLGIVYFEMLALQRPFLAKSEPELRNQHLFDPLPDILKIRPDLPIRLVELVNRMTQKRAQDRYTSMSEVIAVLESVLKDIGTGQAAGDELLKRAYERIAQEDAKVLQAKKESSGQMTEQQLLNCSIESLFSRVKKRVECIVWRMVGMLVRR